ncbi:MAG TPA: hypothetical protein VMN81_11125 [Vicinamibacterales bacterium]|nr:hypothetical protein [Vicinamibacterales bacterium]
MGFLTGRVPRAALAWLVSAAMLFASAGPLVSGHLAVDQECAPAVVEHDHDAHRLGKAPADAPDHCAACHLTRTARDTSRAPALALGILLPELTAEPAQAAPRRVDLRADVTRGPPVSH